MLMTLFNYDVNIATFVYSSTGCPVVNFLVIVKCCIKDEIGCAVFMLVCRLTCIELNGDCMLRTY